MDTLLPGNEPHQPMLVYFVFWQHILLLYNFLGFITTHLMRTTWNNRHKDTHRLIN